MNDKEKDSVSAYSAMFQPTPCLTPDQFTDYAGNRLSGSRRHEIEKHLAQCLFCSDAMEGMISSGDPGELRRTVAELNEKIRGARPSPPGRKRGWRWAYAMAAALPLAVVAFLVLNRTSANDGLFDDYFKPYPNTIPLFRGQEDAGPIESAMAEYESGNYGESLHRLRTLLASEPDNGTAHFYAGICCLCLDDPRAAIVQLDRAAVDDRNAWALHAAWYAALARIKNGDIRSAKASLDTLRFKKSPFRHECLELRDRLKKRGS
jgi:hypothetical protein